MKEVLFFGLEFIRKYNFKATSKFIKFIYKQAEELYKDYPITCLGIFFYLFKSQKENRNIF
jgi:hypothetical protein